MDYKRVDRKQKSSRKERLCFLSTRFSLVKSYALIK